MKFLALGWCSLRAVLRRGFLVGVGRRWGVGGALGLVCVGVRAEPVVSNVTSSQIAGTREVAITYTLADATALAGPFNVPVQASRDNGATWAPVTQVTGAVSDVAPGPGIPITGNVGVEWPGLLLPQEKVRLIADPGMVLIPSGTFTMGSVVASIVGTDKSDGIRDATPHTVTLSAFYIAKTETTYADWIAVRTWARDAARGAGVYDFGATLGGGKGDAHPVHSVSWFDVVKWCNAKSEQEGLTPVYYMDNAQTRVYRTGDVYVNAANVKWGAIGYRLPTEAEWEYAARGGMSGQRFPWGDTITHVQANYWSSASYAYDVSPTRGYHPTYAPGNQPYTSPVGVFAANGYGLSDMVGNVWEWTWDWYGSYGSGEVTDPRGPADTGYSSRVLRGGTQANDARSANRYYNNADIRFNYFGFRPARSSGEALGVPEAPGVPTSVSAVGGNGQAVVSFSAPSNVGSSVITRYTVKATSLSGEVISATGASSPITVVGLVNGGLYTFTVAATSTGGTGAASAASVAVRTADPEMALIPSGAFTMGSVVASIVGKDKSDGITNAPAHEVRLSAFYLGKTETTYAEWVAVRKWAIDPARGLEVYDFGVTLGGGKRDTHPVHSVSWYDVVKWCNAKSEREGLTPVYYTNNAQTAGYVYRTGNVAVTDAQVKWRGNGYRLPTEAEWEYAARGGMSGQRFPWGDTITHVQANYYMIGDYDYDWGATRGNHPTYQTGAYPYTSPVGVFAANGYGLSDMVGNVSEWTWDWYGSYGSVLTDPRGAASGTGSSRVVRGGSWASFAVNARSAFRYGQDPDNWEFTRGFRPARSSGEAPGVPTSVSAMDGNGQAVVSFSAPSNVGSSVIWGYTVKATPVGGGTAVTASGTSSPITVTGLTNGTAYTFTVVATNLVGTGAASSASSAVTPAATAPSVPTSISASGSNGSVTVSFTAPTNMGGSAITGYTVTSSPGGVTATGPSSPITVTGLTNGTAYTFTVTATNLVGTGTASSASSPVTPAIVAVQTADSPLALIPGGRFTMGSVVASIVGTDKSDGMTDATPHEVTLSAFYMAKTETTWTEWNFVRDWAVTRGYSDLASAGSGKADDHPVQLVSWYDVVKWCNAKSEMEGLVPAYYTNDAQTVIHRTGSVALTNNQVKWLSNGYRLPTEAEWEYAARGRLGDKRFPWGDTITHVQANYDSSTSYAYDVSTTRGNHPTYATGNKPYTSPVGVFAANGYGLSDMAGNVLEWIWDRYGSYGSGAVSDPRGAASGSDRVLRGGSWGNVALHARSARRNGIDPDIRGGNVGFRPVRSYTTSIGAALSVTLHGRLINLSVLTDIVAAGDDFTLGYVVGGTNTSGAKPLVIRAAGPSLGAFGVPGTLDDPKLELFAGSTLTGGNDNWGGSAQLTAALAAVGAFAYTGPLSKDAATTANITTRDNSVKVSAVGSGRGTVIAEIYDATSLASFTTATPRLINVSVRKHLGSLLTMGFVVGGSTSAKVLVRGIGPTLGAFGVPDTVADPQLTLFNSSSVKIGENNDWGGTAPLTAAFASVGAFALPSTSKDAALLVTLAPGNYTAQVTGVNGTTGVALVEVYEVP